jgi:hypothetical protein
MSASSLRDSVPPKAPLGYSLGLELQMQLVLDSPGEAALDARQRLLNEMLAGDPLRIFEIVPDTTAGADGLQCVVVVRDNDWFALTGAANDSEFSHDSPPDEAESVR